MAAAVLKSSSIASLESGQRPVGRRHHRARRRRSPAAPPPAAPASGRSRRAAPRPRRAPGSGRAPGRRGRCVERDRAAVVDADEQQAQRLEVVGLGDLADGDDVAERLRHLLAAEVHHARVQPVARELAVAERALGLGDLVLVVREDQVGAAAVDVERLAEVAVRHRRALDVPAGPARAPGARPRTARPAWRPSTARSRAGCASARRPRCARPTLQIVDALARELAVARRTADRRSRRRRRPRRRGPFVSSRSMMSMTSAMCSVARGSSSAGATPSAAQVGVHRRRVYSRATSAAERSRPRPRRMILSSTSVTLRTKRTVEARGAQVADDHVEGHQHARVADVAEVVDGDAAGVHPDLARRRAARTGPSCRRGCRRSAAHQRHRRSSRTRPTRLTAPNITRIERDERRSATCSRGRSPSTSR